MRLYSGSWDSENGQTIARWFGAQIGKEQQRPFSAMGWVDPSGQICSAALFDDHTGSNLEIHIVGRMTRQTIREAFNYCFNQLGILRLTAKPYRSNKPLLKMLPRIGFQYEATLKRFYGPQRGDDALVFRLERPAAEKWIR